MTEDEVRGYWISGAVSFIGVHYPRETGRRLLDGLTRDLRIAAPRIEPATWCTRAQHVELLRAIASASSDEHAIYEDLIAYGQFVASEATNDALRPFMSIVSPRLFTKKLPELWERDHRGGESKLESDFSQVDEAKLPLRLSGIRGYDHVGVAMLGWIKGALASLVGKTPLVKQSGWSLRHVAPSEMVCEMNWS
jgi:hypothetical protein